MSEQWTFVSLFFNRLIQFLFNCSHKMTLHLKFLKFLIILYNFVGSTRFSIGDNAFNLSKLWLIFNLLKTIFIQIPIVWAMSDDKAYFFIYKNEDNQSFSFSLTYLHWVLIRFYYVLEAIELVFMSLYCGTFYNQKVTHLIKYFVKTFKLTGKYQSMMIFKMKKVMFLASITFTINLIFLSQYWNYDSFITIILSITVEVFTCNIFYYFVSMKLFEVYFVHIFKQFIEDIEQTDVLIDFISFQYSSIKTMTKCYNKTFNTLSSIIVSTYLFYNVLKVFAVFVYLWCIRYLKKIFLIFWTLFQVFYVIQSVIELENLNIDIIITFGSYLQFVFVLLYVFHSGDSMESHKKKVIEKLSRIPDKTLSILLISDDICSFKIYKVFPINYKFLMTSFTLCINYVVVIIQFKYKI